jgi:hypothetical protein
MPCDAPGFTMPGIVEERMLRLRPNPPRFSEISNIPHISSDEGSTPSDPHGDSPILSSHDASPQESSARIVDQVKNDFAGTPSLSDEAKISTPPLAPSHAHISNTSTPVVRTSRLSLKIEEITDAELETLLLLQTADPADVASLLEESTVMADDYTIYYWVGDLDPTAEQPLDPQFTPSPGQIFFHLTNLAYNLILKDASEAQQWNIHHILNRLYSYFMKDGFALSWERFVDEDCTKQVSHILTMTVCMWQHYEFEAMGKEHQLLVTTAGVIDALQVSPIDEEYHTPCLQLRRQ